MLKKLLLASCMFTIFGAYASKTVVELVDTHENREFVLNQRTQSSSPSERRSPTRQGRIPERTHSCPPLMQTVEFCIMPVNYASKNTLHYNEWMLLPETEQTKWAWAFLGSEWSLLSLPITTIMGRLVRIAQ